MGAARTSKAHDANTPLSLSLLTYVELLPGGFTQSACRLNTRWLGDLPARSWEVGQIACGCVDTGHAASWGVPCCKAAWGGVDVTERRVLHCALRWAAGQVGEAVRAQNLASL